jgi:hypothetical protein
MKTLGRIAYESMHDPEGFTDWPKLHRQYREMWEAAAQAVRAAVIEECAKVCEQDWPANEAHSWVSETAKWLAREIRALEDKQ